MCSFNANKEQGNMPCKHWEPLTMGHEFSGAIEAIGANVTVFKVGQKVIVDPNSGCNLCSDCHSGHYQLCLKGGVNNTIGMVRNGGWSTHCIVPETQVYAMPDSVDASLAALTEPISCMAHGWDMLSPIHVGQRVLINGAGIIGLLWTCSLHLHGLRDTVTVCETQEKRKIIVRKLGLGYKVCGPADLKDKEFDVIIDCSGNGPAIEATIPLLARGGKYGIFGIASPDTQVSINPYQMYKKEIQICSVNINPYTFPKAIGLLQAMNDTYLSFEKLGIGIYKLSQYKEALDALKRGEISKAMFKM
ncbi:D-altritol 5-dehydrogenase-like isoform X3 [Phymastichus coffea]|uniref:D-altritol 5-dehydrogenase-like isoform X3 n=1 Tax=Phymastichus coffea TaxID=108790 RepID=UPI00273C1417|nr:D-altritol 5-dehydrogenase-like isoform X3 [Phymastichus coffea]